MCENKSQELVESNSRRNILTVIGNGELLESHFDCLFKIIKSTFFCFSSSYHISIYNRGAAPGALGQPAPPGWGTSANFPTYDPADGGPALIFQPFDVLWQRFVAKLAQEIPPRWLSNYQKTMKRDVSNPKNINKSSSCLGEKLIFLAPVEAGS